MTGQGRGDGITRQGAGFSMRPYLKDKGRTYIGTHRIGRCEVCIDWKMPCDSCEAEALFEARSIVRAERDHAQGVYRDTCQDFADRWLKDYPRPKESTNASYRSQLKRFLEDFGGRQMRSITRPEARAWALNNRHRVKAVTAMFSDALNEGIIEDTPWRNLRLPGSPGRRDLVPLTESELVTLADIASEYHSGELALTMRAAILTLGYVGLRPAELYALLREDFDFDRGEVTISKSRHKRILSTTKTGRSRTVICPEPASLAVQAIPRHMNAEYPIFRSRRGNCFSAESFGRYFNPVRDIFEERLEPARRKVLAESRKGNTKLTAYELRHGCASMLLDRGASLADVAYQLGHSDTRLVESLYGHPDSHLTRERLHAAFRKSDPLRVVPNLLPNSEADRA